MHPSPPPRLEQGDAEEGRHKELEPVSLCTSAGEAACWTGKGLRACGGQWESLLWGEKGTLCEWKLTRDESWGGRLLLNCANH